MIDNFELLVLAWLAIGLIAFITLLYIPAPYGKFAKKNKNHFSVVLLTANKNYKKLIKTLYILSGTPDPNRPIEVSITSPTFNDNPNRKLTSLLLSAVIISVL